MLITNALNFLSLLQNCSHWIDMVKRVRLSLYILFLKNCIFWRCLHRFIFVHEHHFTKNKLEYSHLSCISRVFLYYYSRNVEYSFTLFLILLNSEFKLFFFKWFFIIIFKSKFEIDFLWFNYQSCLRYYTVFLY